MAGNNVTVTLEITDDISGVAGSGKIMDTQSGKGYINMDVAHYPTGVYLLQLQVGEETLYRKWVKGK